LIQRTSTPSRQPMLLFDRGVVLALAIGLLAALPFLTRPGLPRQTDAELHVYRAAELGHSVRQGTLYPRWAPDLYFGYGYPIFNYYAPFTYYLANAFDLIPGVGIVAGVKGVFVLGLGVAALGSYLLGRDLFGAGPGIIVAACFTFSPYVVFIDPHARGDLAEHFAVCLLPMTFYAFGRLLRSARRGALVGSVLSLACVVFSHNLLGLAAGILVLGYVAWEALFGVSPKRARWGLIAILLAAFLLAFFWLPFLLERSAIRLEVIGPGHFDYREHFLSMSELLAPARILDLGASAPRYRLNLGVPQWAIAAVALGLCATRRRVTWHPAWKYFVVVTASAVFLMLPQSDFVWESVPGMPYLQFPWRLMGLSSLSVAVVAGGGAAALLSCPSRSGPILAAALLFILGGSLPVLFPPMWGADFGGTAPKDIVDWEIQSLALGTTSSGDFLPVEAALAPLRPEPGLLDSYEGPGIIDRVNRATLPATASVEIVEQRDGFDRMVVESGEGIVLRLFRFYFPGWTAYVDGVESAIEVAGPEGFITVPVPPGTHEVVVEFGDTPARTAGWLSSAIGVAAMAVAVWLMRAPRGNAAAFPPMSTHVSRWAAAGLALFVVFKAAVIDPNDACMRYTSPPGEAWAARSGARVNFGDKIVLLGYDLPDVRVHPGDSVPVVLYWRTMAPLSVNYQSFVHLLRPRDTLWGQEDHLNPGEAPTSRWPLDKYIWDTYSVSVPLGTPPGEYTVSTGLYSLEDGYRVTVYDEDHVPAGDNVTLGTVRVERPWRQPEVDDLAMTAYVGQSLAGGELTLLGYYQEADIARLPGVWTVALYWRAETDGPSATGRDLVLLDDAGRVLAQSDGIPVDGEYPFRLWQSGDVVRDLARLKRPNGVGFDPGRYDFGVVVTPEGHLVRLGTVEVVVEQ
jgi:hypothetical protein